MDMGPMGIYRLFDEGDHKEMGDGGMMNKAPDIPVSSWNFYFNVDSINAAVQARPVRWREGLERSDAGSGRRLDHQRAGSSGSHVLSGQ